MLTETSRQSFGWMKNGFLDEKKMNAINAVKDRSSYLEK